MISIPYFIVIPLESLLSSYEEKKNIVLFSSIALLGRGCITWSVLHEL